MNAPVKDPVFAAAMRAPLVKSDECASSHPCPRCGGRVVGRYAHGEVSVRCVTSTCSWADWFERYSAWYER